MNTAPLDSILDETLDRLHPLSGGGHGLRSALSVTVIPVADAPAEVMDFIASDETVDRYGEVIVQAGWRLDRYRQNPVVVDSHDYSSIARILGRSETTEVRDGRLVNRVRFALENPLGRLARDLAAGGFIRSQSVGFIPVEWQDGNPERGEPRRRYTVSELVEISLVAVPANPGATIGAALKSGATSLATVRSASDQLRELICSFDPLAPTAAIAAAHFGPQQQAAAPSDSGPQTGACDGGQLWIALAELSSVLRRSYRR